jgi:hypothetical protein
MRLFWLSVCVLCGFSQVARGVAILVVGWTIAKYVVLALLPAEEQ